MHSITFYNITTTVIPRSGAEKNLTQKTRFTQRKVKKSQCPKMVSKRLYGLYLRSHEQFLVVQKFKIGFITVIRFYFEKFTSHPNVKSDFGHFLVHFLVFSGEKSQFDEKNRFYPQKVQKKSISKNSVQSRVNFIKKSEKKYCHQSGVNMILCQKKHWIGGAKKNTRDFL